MVSDVNLHPYGAVMQSAMKAKQTTDAAKVGHNVADKDWADNSFFSRARRVWKSLIDSRKCGFVSERGRG